MVYLNFGIAITKVQAPQVPLHYSYYSKLLL